MNPDEQQSAPVGGGEATVAHAEKKNMLMGILAYVGILVIVPFLMAKDDPFVKFHIKQGLVLFVIWLALWVLGMFFGMMLYMLMPFISLIQLATLVLAIIGIINVVQGKEKELPLVGQFSKYFTF